MEDGDLGGGRHLMRILLVDAYAPDDPDRAAVDETFATLVGSGHTVTRIELVAESFHPAMTVEEREAYHADDNIVSDEVRRSAELVGEVDALLFAYPTVTFTMPQIMKAWLERVLLPGVAFVFDPAGRVAPGMTNIKRIGIVTTRPHGRVAIARARDGGRAVILRALRLSCARTCRRTFVGMPSGGVDRARIRRRFARW
jgi:NAD(P)H dehydrogenase (quinone)